MTTHGLIGSQCCNQPAGVQSILGHDVGTDMESDTDLTTNERMNDKRHKQKSFEGPVGVGFGRVGYGRVSALGILGAGDAFSGQRNRRP